MIKRMILVGGTALMVSTLLFGRDVWSYVRTSAGCLKSSVSNSVPMEFQLERARQMIKDLTPEVQKNMHAIAKEEVELQRLESQIADSETRLARDKSQMTRLKGDLVSGREEFHYGGRLYTVEQVKLDLANRFDRYKTADATLASMKQIQTARQRSLDAARQKLEGMLAAKRQLDVEVENLAARNQMIAAAETTSNYNFDDSELGRVKELISGLRERLEVNERLVNADQYYHDEIPVDKTAPDNIAEQISRYFSPPKPAAVGAKAVELAKH
jgi:chromosome segregation ATPase